MTSTPSIAALEAEIAKLQEQKQKLIDEQRPKELESVKAVIQAFGFTADELGVKPIKQRKSREPKTGKPKAAPSASAHIYINPKDRSMTWGGGRGQKPKWVRDFLEAGGNLDDLLKK